MKNEFIKNMIYEKEKDTCFRSSAYFYQHISNKYKIRVLKEEYGDVYKKILNYQIKKYGSCLTYSINRNDKGVGKRKSKEKYDRTRRKRVMTNKSLEVYGEMINQLWESVGKKK